LTYWLVMFSTSCFANMLGLNISASFNSAKVIYILIPILIIPQLLFSGVIVSFDKLHPTIKSDKAVPLIGNIMASRWAYEALAVYQFEDNKFERVFYDREERRKFSNWKLDYWMDDLHNAGARIRLNYGVGDKEQAKVAEDMGLLRNEIQNE